MGEKGELIGLEEAEREVARYLRTAVHKEHTVRDVFVESVKLTEVAGVPVYDITGRITLERKRPRLFGTQTEKATTDFKIQMDPKSGKIVGKDILSPPEAAWKPSR